MALALEKDKGVPMKKKCVKVIYETECSADFSAWY